MLKCLLRKTGWTCLILLVSSPSLLRADWVAHCDYRNVDGTQPSQTFATQQQCLDAINETYISSSHCNCSPVNSGGGSQGLSPEQIQQNQDRADATKLDQRGQEAFQKGDCESAMEDFQQALGKDPDNSSIRQDLQTAKYKIAERKKFNENKQDALSQLKGGLKQDDVDADGLKGLDDPADGGLKDAGSDNSGLKPLVDTRGAQESLPRQAEEIEKSLGYGEARKGFQCIANHDFAAAKAWYGQALLKDPHNKALARMADLCDFTEKAVEKAKRNKAGGLLGKEKEWTGPEAKKMKKTIKALYPKLVLPDPKDMELLDMGQNIVVPTSQDMEFLGTLMGQNVVLPKDEDMLFLFPGDGPAEEALKVPKAKVNKEYLTNTNSVIARQLGGVGLENLWTGSENEGIADLKKAKKLDPHNPDYGLVLKYWGPNN